MENKKSELDKNKDLEIKPIKIVLEPTKEQVGKIKEALNDKDPIEDDEMTKLKEKRIKSESNRIILGHLFIDCFGYVKNNLSKIEDKEDDKELLKAKEVMLKYLEEKNNQRLRDFIEDYGDGQRYGSFFVGEKIKDIVKENKEDMDKVISIFFKIFEEED